MTTKGEWVAYTGSDEQITEIQNAKEFIYRYKTQSGKFVESYIEDTFWKAQINDLSHYWIIPDDPLREMKIRQATTGQLVYIDLRKCIYPYQADPDDSVLSVIKDGRAVEIGISTCNPKWNIPNAEYSFTPFKE